MITVPCASFARLLVPCFLIFATSAFAQQQSLEMQTGTGGPAGNGPSVASQAVTLRRNTDNPAGNTFVARTPAITVTYSLSAQQYTGLTAAQGFPASTGGNAVVFGGTTSGLNIVGAPLYVAQNTFGGGVNGSLPQVAALQLGPGSTPQQMPQSACSFPHAPWHCSLRQRGLPPPHACEWPISP